MPKNQRILLIVGGAVAACLAAALVAVYLLGGRGAGPDTGVLARLQSGLTAVTGGHAWAQEASTDVEEVVVTALKRATTVQSTPISISAVTSESLEKLGASSIQDYYRTVPNLRVVGVDAEKGFILVEGAVPGHKGAWVTVKDAVKKALPKEAPKPAGLKAKAAAPEAAAAQA